MRHRLCADESALLHFSPLVLFGGFLIIFFFFVSTAASAPGAAVVCMCIWLAGAGRGGAYVAHGRCSESGLASFLLFLLRSIIDVSRVGSGPRREGSRRLGGCGGAYFVCASTLNLKCSGSGARRISGLGDACAVASLSLSFSFSAPPFSPASPSFRAAPAAARSPGNSTLGCSLGLFLHLLPASHFFVLYLHSRKLASLHFTQHTLPLVP